MNESIFTKIINGDIPSHKIYEDDKTLAFLDIHPAQRGHTLVIPKKQVEFVWDLPVEDYQALMSAVQKVALVLREKLPVKYVGTQIVGTDVPHAHVHLMPFNTMDEFRNIPDPNDDPDHKTLAALAQTLRIGDN